jgi:hypothetical protein
MTKVGRKRQDLEDSRPAKVRSHMKRYAVMAALVSAALFVAGGAASAAIVATTGSIVHIAPPPTVSVHALESDTEMYAFDEQQNVTLPVSLDVDITQPGTYNDDLLLTPGTIPAGTVVSSHFVHADGPNREGRGGAPQYLGTIELDSDILGIAVLAPALDGSDILGAPGTIYPTGGTQRQLNLGSGDFVIEHPDVRTVTVKVAVRTHLDQVRIITKGDDPNQGGQGCTPGYWKQAHHYDSWVGYTPDQSFESVFGRDAFGGDPSLGAVVGFGGGGVNALGRHAVAALLNASSADVSYEYSTSEVISMFQAAFDSGAAAIESTKDLFDVANNAGCPLN